MKKGITVSLLVVVITIMIIVVSAVSVVGVKSIDRANYEAFKSKVDSISDLTLEYITTNKTLPVTDEVVGKGMLDANFLSELSENLDTNNKIMVIDLSKLDTTVDIGKGTVSDGDVFVLCENTNNVYYLKGFEYGGVVYHSNKWRK